MSSRSSLAQAEARPAGNADGEPDPPRPPRPLWVRWTALILFVIVLGVAFVNLGEWQLRRLEQRKTSNAIILRNEAAPVAAFDQVFTGPIAKTQEWARVQVTGTFDPTHQFVIRYRDNGDATGFEVVTPLRTASGQSVLVDRGFIPVDKGTQIPSVGPTPPSGEVTVVGHVRRNETGSRNATTPVNGQMRLINSAAVAPVLGYPVVDGYIGLLQIQPGQSGDFQAIHVPELSDGPHFWYAVQWFMFTGIGVAGVVVFIRGDIRERRAARLATEKATENATEKPTEKATASQDTSAAS